MPHSLEVKTPPSPNSKRQRSADGREYLTPGLAGSTRSASRAQSPALPVKIPAFLNKSRSGKLCWSNDPFNFYSSAPRVSNAEKLSLTDCTEISNSFQELDWNQRFRLQDAFTNPRSQFKIDRSPTVVSRNRYANVQPWDSSRIKLKSPLGGSDYVNASPIKLKALTPNSSQKASSIVVSSQESTTATEPSTEKDSNNEVILFEKKYIATQGPKDGHFSHFWHMVMQETVGDVGVIVMLTTCYEGNKEKCSQYFPATMKNATIHLSINEAGEDERIAVSKGDPFCDISSDDADTDSDKTDNSDPIPEGGPVQAEADKSTDKVTLLSLTQDTTTGCEVREMRLDIGGQSKKIYHYLFSNWPDFGKPEAEDRKALLELVKQSAQRTGRPDNPRFVHCSAGVGRTGTFIALDHLLQELENGNLANADALTPNGKTATSTWGRSGPPRVSTPEGKEDVIYDTVDKLREQRMMMVMNELQFIFLYEVLKEAFVEKYSRKSGQAVAVTDEMPSKVPRIEKQSVNEEVNRQGGEGGDVSEAETEVMDADGEKDPYGAVSPDTVRQEQERAL